MTSPFVGELIGTMLLILLGDGVVANVVLGKTKGNSGGWIVITTAWALAVFVGAYASAVVSGAHLNPAVTIGLAVGGGFSWRTCPLHHRPNARRLHRRSARLVAYFQHWGDPRPGCQAGCLLDGGHSQHGLEPVTEIIGTFVLMFGIFAIRGTVMDPEGTATAVNMGALGIIPVAFLVWAIGLSLGGPTGYAINPARDLGPRIAHFLLPIPGKGSSDWGYSWLVGPIIGAVIAALLWNILGWAAL
jgi:glycerol uptake facilitator protein